MQNAKSEQEVIDLSKEKWRWMSERKVDSLAVLFHEKAVFVHMGATMSRTRNSKSLEAAGFTTKTWIFRKCRCGLLAQRLPSF